MLTTRAAFGDRPVPPPEILRMAAFLFQVETIKSLVANAFLVRAESTIIVDTGNPGNAPAFCGGWPG